MATGGEWVGGGSSERLERRQVVAVTQVQVTVRAGAEADEDGEKWVDSRYG